MESKRKTSAYERIMHASSPWQNLWVRKIVASASIYLPDLTPSDYLLFHIWKKTRRKKCGPNSEGIAKTNAYFEGWEQSYFLEIENVGLSVSNRKVLKIKINLTGNNIISGRYLSYSPRIGYVPINRIKMPNWYSTPQRSHGSNDLRRYHWNKRINHIAC